MLPGLEVARLGQMNGEMPRKVDVSSNPTRSRPRLRAYMACSLDGFIAGPGDDLSWLEATRSGPLMPDPQALDFETFLVQVGCLLMGRRTYDTVAGFQGAWPYGALPVRVATSRPLSSPLDMVSPVAGSIQELVATAKRVAGGKDVYLDGGALVQQALKAGLVDELILTYVPVLLTAGVRLFDDLVGPIELRFTAHYAMPNGMLQLWAEPCNRPAAAD